MYRGGLLDIQKKYDIQKNGTSENSRIHGNSEKNMISGVYTLAAKDAEQQDFECYWSGTPWSGGPQIGGPQIGGSQIGDHRVGDHRLGDHKLGDRSPATDL